MSRRKNRKHLVCLSKKQADRAVYIDFEGFKDKSPSFVGVLDETGFKQIVLALELQPAARAKGCSAQSINYWARRLINRCLHENRLIVGFSMHDLNCLKNYTSVGDQAEPIYVNALQAAKKWHWREYKIGLDGSRTLEAYCAIAKVPQRPDDYCDIPVTLNLKAIMSGLNARGTYRKLTRLQKQKWAALLEYNRWDCRDLRALCDIVAK